MNGRTPTLPTGLRTQRGAASLVVVMVLFFIISLVAAYTSRNLIFEQRTSVNQYKATQAFEAAEAGLQWAIALLNGGRIGADCVEASATATDASFRQRYLSIDIGTNPATAGRITPVALTNGAAPGCVWDGTNWVCQCPTTTAPGFAAPGGAGVFPAFRVRFSLVGVTKPGVVRIESNGCTRYDNACLNSAGTNVDIEGRAVVTALVALKNAVTTPPAAALTVLGDVVGGGALAAYNTDTDRGGITIQAGGAINSAGFTLRSIPGTPASNSLVPSDPSISALSGAPDRLFASVFGAWPNAYRLQPAAIITLVCPAGGCSGALAAAVAKNPDRVIWIDGDLVLETAGDIGTLPDPAAAANTGPATIVATGQVQFLAPGVRIFGFVHSRTGNWSGNGEIQGAAFVESDLAATAAPTVVFNGAVLDSLRLRSGSFVIVPGSWRDFFQ